MRRWVPGAVLAAGLVATALAGWLVNSVVTAAEDANAERAADHAAAAVRLVLDRAATTVRAVRAMYAAGEVSEAQFQRFAQTLASSDGVSAIGFVRRVLDADRAVYEARLTDPPGSALGIWELAEDNTPVRSAARPSYMVLEMNVSPLGRSIGWGLDIASVPDRADDLRRAIDRFQLTLSNEIQLPSLNEAGITVYDPVVDADSRPIGVAAGSISRRAVMKAAVDASGVPGIGLSLGPPGSGVRDATPTGVAEMNDGPRTARTFSFADRLVTVTAPAHPGTSYRPWIVALVVGLGLMSTATLLASLLNSAKSQALRRAEERLRAMLDGLGPIALLIAPDGTVMQANSAAAATFGQSEKDMLHRHFEKLIPAADESERRRLADAVEAAATHGQNVRFDVKLDGPDGRQVYDVWIRRKESSGNLVVSAVDVSDRYEAEETQRLLMRELDHRMKNTLQVIQAIIRRTASGHDSIAKFEEALLGRVTAMSRAHDLLASEHWHGADIAAVVRQETEHIAGPRAVSINGPGFRLSPKAALSLALVLHELGTNALKYGALSVPTGRVEIGWHMDRSGKEACLVLHWQEAHGPPVAPAKRRGFGSLLIERSIAYELDGLARLDYREEGLACTITVPLRTVRSFAQAHRPVLANAAS